MGLFDFFKKHNSILAVIRPNMTEAELVAAMEPLSGKLMHFIQRHAIGFYRDIGSHDFSGYPGVMEEFFYLVLIVTESRIRTLTDDASADNAVASLRNNLSAFLKKHDKNLEQKTFWDLYEQRASLYRNRLSTGSVSAKNENLISAFSVNVRSRLDDWPSLVSHHSANASMAVLSELCGDDC